MASRNDPERLEAEAREMLSKMAEPEAESPVDEEQTEEVEALAEETPEPEDTVEVESVDEAPAFEEESGEVAQMQDRLEKAEKAMKGAQARMTKATQEAADLRKLNADLMQAVGDLKGQLEERQKDNEQLAKIREEYPDIAGPLLDELSRTQAEVSSTKEALAAEERRRQEAVQVQAQAEHFDRIRAVHPDVDQLIETADWINWLEVQDASTQQWIERGSSNDVNAVLYRFKADMGMKPPTPQEQALEKARKVAEPKMPKTRKPNTGGKKTWTVEEIKRMPNKDFERYQGEILKAMEQGAIRR
jgi:DNA repair exonuclease SbcCD ATPase subunit